MNLRVFIYKCSLPFLIFLVIVLAAMEVFCKEDLKITKDKNGTTYTVGSEESRREAVQEEERDKERAWDMLRNSNIIIDKRK